MFSQLSVGISSELAVRTMSLADATPEFTVPFFGMTRNSSMVKYTPQCACTQVDDSNLLNDCCTDHHSSTATLIVTNSSAAVG